MVGDGVISQKVRPPAAGGLIRGRLLQPLIAPGGAEVAVLIAPAGCGKTTLLAQAASATSAPAGWYRAERGDSSETAFVRHVATALPGVCTGTRLAATVDDLLREFDRWSGDDVLLVVDDVHELAGTPAEHALNRLVALRPPGLRILLGCRRRPALHLSRLQVADQVHDLDQEDLRFRSWEAERLFSDVYRERLPPESAAALTRRTGGWAAGLQLFHLATAGKSTAERRAAVDALTGRSRLIRSYLAENVLAELRPELRAFLVRTAGLTVLSAEVCDSLLETSGSQALLMELEAGQVFTTSPDGGLTFRFHQVLQDHLEVALQDDLGTGTQAWYRRSAEVLERSGHLPQALRAYACAEEWGAVAQVLRRAGADLMQDSRADWEGLDPIPRAVEDPWLALVAARRQLRRGALAAAVDGFRRAEELLPDPAFQARCRQERAVATLWLPGPSAGRSSEPRGRPGVRHWSEQVRAATVRLTPVAGSSGSAGAGDGLAAGLICLLRGDVREGISRLEAFADAAADDSVEHVVALTAGALADALVGGCHADRLERAALAADVAGQPWLERLGRMALTLLLPSGRATVSALADTVRQCRSDGDDWAAALVLLLHGAQLAGSPGDHPAERSTDDPADRTDPADALREAEDLFAGLGAPVLAVWARALRALALAARGAPDAAGTARSAETAARQVGAEGARSLARSVVAGLDGAPRSGDAVLPSPARGAGRRTVDVRLRLLAEFSLVVDGRAATWPGVRPKVLTLLRLMSLSLGVDVHRETLMEALWPGAPVEVGTHRLQVAVSSLRGALEAAGLPGPELLERRGEAYRLSLPPGASVDVGELECALADASAARSVGDVVAAGAAADRALRLYRGDLLPGDGPAEWVVEARSRLRLRMSAAAHELAEDCLEVGDVRAGVEAARRSLELEPFQDSVWDLLSRLYQQGGDRAAAEHARRQRWHAVADLSHPARPRPDVTVPRPRSALNSAG